MFSTHIHLLLSPAAGAAVANKQTHFHTKSCVPLNDIVSQNVKYYIQINVRPIQSKSKFGFQFQCYMPVCIFICHIEPVIDSWRLFNVGYYCIFFFMCLNVFACGHM